MTDPTRPPLASALDLRPHPEGGWFRETYRCAATIDPPGYGGPRAAATAILYLLSPGERSAWHVVRSDELWLWHAGGPLDLTLGGSGERPSFEGGQAMRLGGAVLDGRHPQALVPGGVWQSAEPAGDEAVLVSCVVSPGFDFADFRLA